MEWHRFSLQLCTTYLVQVSLQLPASCTMGTWPFPGVESGQGMMLTPHPLLVLRSKNRVELYLYSPYGPSWPIKMVKPTSVYNST
jgi:hypothetical protein